MLNLSPYCPILEYTSLFFCFRNIQPNWHETSAPTSLCFWNIKPNWHQITGHPKKKVYTRIRYNLSPYCLTLETTSLCVWQIQSHWHQTIEANVAVGFLYNMKVCTEAKPLTLLPNFKIYFCRVVTRLDWCPSTKHLLSQCGWLSVNQLIFYHSVLQLHKVRLSGSPMYLYTMHNSWSYSYRTRQAETGLVQLMGILG